MVALSVSSRADLMASGASARPLPSIDVGVVDVVAKFESDVVADVDDGVGIDDDAAADAINDGTIVFASQLGYGRSSGDLLPSSFS